MQPLGCPALATSFPGPNVAFARVDASSWVTNWQGSRSVGFSEPLGDAGSDAVVEGDGDAGADVAGAWGGSGVGGTDAFVAGVGVAGAVAVADTFDRGVVTLLLLDDLQDVISNAEAATTR